MVKFGGIGGNVADKIDIADGDIVGLIDKQDRGNISRRMPRNLLERYACAGVDSVVRAVDQPCGNK